jgi:MOSC domain-containing protein YiiM
VTGIVLALASSAGHDFSKQAAPELRLLAGLGVEGDAHQGATVKHRSRVAADPTRPNLRQVHLIHAELLDELASRGFTVRPGDLGENITTRGIDLLALPRGALLRIGDAAVLEVTGLRNPCRQIERFQSGLLAAVLDKRPNGEVIRKSGIMTIVLASGTVKQGDAVALTLPPEPHLPLECV